MSQTRLTTIGLTLLRFSLAAVFLWFGFTQLQAPAPWTAYLPGWVGNTGISEIHFVLLNGWFEIVAATLLILGSYTRITALLLALHLFGIAATIGVTAVGVRDMGLSFATLAIVFLGAGPFSIDTLPEKSEVLPD